MKMILGSEVADIVTESGDGLVRVRFWLIGGDRTTPPSPSSPPDFEAVMSHRTASELSRMLTSALDNVRRNPPKPFDS